MYKCNIVKLLNFRLSSDEKNFFQSILISQLCDTVHRFIEMIEDGYYDFYSLPIGLKKRLAKEDHKQLEENFSKVSFQGSYILLVKSHILVV